MKVKATVAYDGSGFHGFAVNEDVRTVAGELEAAVARIAGEQVTITCAGRTDKGVHARGQVISFELSSEADGDASTGRVDLGRLQYSLNRLCGPEIVVADLTVVDDDFDARFSARWRRYRYLVWNAALPDPFRRHTSWHVGDRLDVESMHGAAQHLVGEHDFSSFCRRPKVPEGEPGASLVREVLDATWERGLDDESDLLTFEVRATSFCHQMVRSLVGTLVDVGRGRIGRDEMPSILAARDRDAAGPVAPPHGLTLWAVGYPTTD